MKSKTLYYIAAVGILALIVLLVLRNRPCADGFQNAYTLTAYTVDWCPHCQTFKPELEKLGSSQTVNGKSVTVVSVNPEKEPAKKNPAVKGFPTVILSKPDGTSDEYSGQRTADAIISFLKSTVN